VTKNLLIVIFTLISQSAFAQYTPKAGDFLLQDLDCGDLCTAIEKVTPALKGKRFSHIGFVCSVNDSLYVIEAIGPDVHLTKVQEFINRNKDAQNKPKIVVMRLQNDYQALVQPATLFCLKQLGKAYDDTFIYDNGKYYCSELLYDAFKSANKNQAFFDLQPMTFIDPETKQTFPAWTQYYNDLKFAIPEGLLGCNPGGIANSPKLTVVHSFY
jgi:Permuted papain-like amidase enzyme, YaeF/YiiX, C92 family